MMIRDILEETYVALSGNKIRSGLTILGIVIGIGSVIAMLGVGQGAQNSIQASIQSVGSSLLIVVPGAQRGVGIQASGGRGSAQTLSQEDADAISQSVSLAQGVAPDLTRRFQVATKGQNTNTQVIGTTPAYQSVRNINVDEGSFISDQQVRTMARVALLGPTTRDDLFGQGASAIGQNIRINGIVFRVIGITHAKGGSGFANPDDAVYVPLSTGQHFLAGTTNVSTISVQAQSQDVMTSVQNQITQLLLSRHHISDPQAADFSVLNQADIVATASSVTGTFTILLASIASISLLVGGIGIMNMMLTNVTERTREIGLRKALGAKRGDITIQFLSEAITLTVLGGMVGIMLGWLLIWGVAQFAGIAAAISLNAIMLAVGVSTIIGVAFGYYPARTAARLNPIDALRYE